MTACLYNILANCYTLLYMSTLVAVRIPDELLYKIDAKGKRSRVILEALESYFAMPAQRDTYLQSSPA